MSVIRNFFYICLVLVLVRTVTAQETSPATDPAVPQLRPGSARPTPGPTAAPAAAVPQKIALTVPKGTSLQVALEKEVRIKREGQSVHGQVVEPVYAFD